MYLYAYIHISLAWLIRESGSICSKFLFKKEKNQQKNQFLSPHVVRCAHFANLNQFLPPPKTHGALHTYFIPGG